MKIILLSKRPLSCMNNNDQIYIITTAISILLIFITTHLCKRGFSTISNLKNSKRNRFHIEHDLWITLCKIKLIYNVIIIIISYGLDRTFMA